MKDKDLVDEINSGLSDRPNISIVSSMSQGAREHQEDSMGYWSDTNASRWFAVVADGAGGHGGGAEASKAAIDSASMAWEKIDSQAPTEPAVFLAEWMADAHQAVNDAAAKIHKSARSVVVACYADASHATWVHAGDCRLLRFHKGKLAERTRDDSVVQVLFERGEISEDEMGTHPDQSRLLQSLGGEDAPKPRTGSSSIEAGDVLILCSDGFWEHLTSGELEKLAATRPEKRQEVLDRTVAEAVKRAGKKADNTTAMMISFDCQNSSRVRLPWIFWCFVTAAVILLAAIINKGKWNGWKKKWNSFLQPVSYIESSTVSTQYDNKFFTSIPH